MQRYNARMQLKLIVALVVLFAVIILGGVLIAWPPPNDGGAPFVSENVIITAPLAGERVAKTFPVRGQARGSWMFEASFPMEVRDPSGEIVGHGFSMTTEDWMTTEFVSYEGKIEVADYSGPATLVLKKDNPSGLPEHDDSVSIPIVIE